MFLIKALFPVSRLDQQIKDLKIQETQLKIQVGANFNNPNIFNVKVIVLVCFDE